MDHTEILIGNSSNRSRKESVSQYLVSLSEELKRAIHHDGECRPELIVGRSEILDIEDISNIKTHILENSRWTLAYSSSLHPRSLEGLYHRLSETYCEEDGAGPVLILVKDVGKEVFGALVSSNFQPSNEDLELDHSILFTCRPKFEIFAHMRDDERCKVQCNYQGLNVSLMGGNGEFWLSSDLKRGRVGVDLPEIVPKKVVTHHIGSPTKSNRKISHEPQPPMFAIKTVECWVIGACEPQFCNPNGSL